MSLFGPGRGLIAESPASASVTYQRTASGWENAAFDDNDAGLVVDRKEGQTKLLR